MGVGA